MLVDVILEKGKTPTASFYSVSLMTSEQKGVTLKGGFFGGLPRPKITRRGIWTLWRTLTVILQVFILMMSHLAKLTLTRCQHVLYLFV